MKDIVRKAIGTDLTPLQAKVFLILLDDKVVSVNGLLKKGFSEKTIRYLFRKWKSLDIITPMPAGLYRISNDVLKQVTPRIKEEIEKIAANYSPSTTKKRF